MKNYSNTAVLSLVTITGMTFRNALIKSNISSFFRGRNTISSLKLEEGNITISLLMNITMNQLGGASVIAKFHS